MFRLNFVRLAKMKPTENIGGTDDLRLNLLTQEIKFARMLAGNTFDGAIKEKHIDRLSDWLKNRAACTEGTFNVFRLLFFLTELEFYYNFENLT